MSNSWDDAAVRQGPWVVTEKYARPSVSGSCPLASSCRASDVAPRYLRSADRSSGKLTHPEVTVAEQAGARPFFAWSSNPATVDWTSVSPDPWSTCCPVSGRTEVCTAPLGIVNDAGCVIVEAGRGAAYAGTRSSGWVSLVSTTLPLASASYWRGRPPWSRSTVGSMVFGRPCGASGSVSVTVLLDRGSIVTELGETEYVAPGIVVRSANDTS